MNNMINDELGPDVEDTLSRARRALAPTEVNQAKVWRAVQAAVAAGGIQQAVPPRPVRETPRVGRWAKTLAASAVVAGVSGAWGYRVGRRAGLDEAGATLARAVSRATTPVMPAATGGPTPAPVRADDGVADSERARASVPTEPPRAVAPAPGHRRLARSHESATAVPVTQASLDKEVRALRAVERALRERQPSLALALLADLDREIPRGSLVEERQATAAIARCAAGDVPFDVDLADLFASQYPSSVYLDRVRRSCAPDRPHRQTDPDVSGDGQRNRR
jgi:hypothetical protein